ncbi:hypothetical protein LZ30DRAFT_65720 [Colletotrichum cereale]|nr:hypothetical protein LZ30DRAFT_65720 [Colletotrichum cereale]
MGDARHLNYWSPPPPDLRRAIHRVPTRKLVWVLAIRRWSSLHLATSTSAVTTRRLSRHSSPLPLPKLHCQIVRLICRQVTWHIGVNHITVFEGGASPPCRLGPCSTAVCSWRQELSSRMQLAMRTRQGQLPAKLHANFTVPRPIGHRIESWTSRLWQGGMSWLAFFFSCCRAELPAGRAAHMVSPPMC